MTAYYGDLAPDDPSVVRDGIAPLADRLQGDIPSEERWGAIGMWAWGLSQMRRAADGIPGLDARRAVVIGHSRLGKAALWAGAQDEAFAMVVSNDSGEGGAALSRRMYGETIARITRSFPHWFCPTLATYADRVPELPVDQHQLLALVAPRVLHVASAVEDRWADPRGEFLATQAADEVWRLFGVRGLEASEMPAVDQPVGARVRYHVRTGGHDITRYDWAQYLDTASCAVAVNEGRGAALGACARHVARSGRALPDDQFPAHVLAAGVGAHAAVERESADLVGAELERHAPACRDPLLDPVRVHGEAVRDVWRRDGEAHDVVASHVDHLGVELELARRDRERPTSGGFGVGLLRWRQGSGEERPDPAEPRAPRFAGLRHHRASKTYNETDPWREWRADYCAKCTVTVSSTATGVPFSRGGS